MSNCSTHVSRVAFGDNTAIHDIDRTYMTCYECAISFALDLCHHVIFYVNNMFQSSFSKDSDMVEAFQCTQTQSNRYVKAVFLVGF